MITNIRSIVKATKLFGDDLPMNLKELKKYANELDDIGKRELIYFCIHELRV